MSTLRARIFMLRSSPWSSALPRATRPRVDENRDKHTSSSMRYHRDGAGIVFDLVCRFALDIFTFTGARAKRKYSDIARPVCANAAKEISMPADENAPD